MPATLIELFEGRSQDISGKLSAVIPYAIIGATDEDDAKATALASIPTTHNGIPRSGISGLECINASTWKVTARYQQPDSSGGSDTAVLENTFTFETGGGTQNVKQSRGYLSRRYSDDDPSGGTLVESAINFDGENVNGVDIVIPQYQWSETYWWATASDAFKAIIANNTGCYNNATFRGFAAGEVLFLGASGTKQGNGWWQITYKFAYSKNQASLSIGTSGITVAAKKGWDYLWIRYEDAIDAAMSNRIKKPVAAYIEEVYQPADFSVLGIG